MGPWLLDIESLEQVSQDEPSRRIVLCMAQLYREGRLEPFVSEVARDPDFDDDTRAAITELAGDQAFLLAVENYLRCTCVIH